MKLCSLGLTVLIITLPILAENISEESAWKLGWPRMQGPHGNFHVPQTGTELVEDLSNARMVWESDTRDFGRAKHNRFLQGKVHKKERRRIFFWAAPIIAEGKVFTPFQTCR